eukprot:TRINITY_DN19_c1_g1_i1.p1 TRINITY_DN19_c1_g1~~TRINITY_DN19_c1_g1_i1.p1  ORF type:complete len:202 (+),score=46.52 TRINITY_DN19_c1_g1_i1:48-653(+)
MGCGNSQPVQTTGYNLNSGNKTDTTAKATDDENFYLFKILVIGDSSVGKSSLLLRFADGDFNSNFLSTIGVDFKLKTIEVGNSPVKLQIWDTAGQERFRNITRSYYRGAHGIMLVYDVTNEESFANIDYWLKEVDKFASPNVHKILVGNKNDLVDERVVSEEDGRQLAASMDIKFLETSAKEATNVNEAFTQMAIMLKEKA